jgi:hypothetical protein
MPYRVMAGLVPAVHAAPSFDADRAEGPIVQGPNHRISTQRGCPAQGRA